MIGIEVNGKYQNSGLYDKKYLIDVPATENMLGREDVVVTLYTMRPEDNTEALAQVLAEADCYSINHNEYFNEELGNWDMAQEKYCFNISYRKVKKTTFETKLKNMLLEAKEKNDDAAMDDLKDLIEDLPSVYLESVKYAHQVLDEIVKGLLDFSKEKFGETSLEYFRTKRLYYIILTRFNFYNGAWRESYQGSGLNSDHFRRFALGGKYWYKVREMLGKGDFYKFELFDDVKGRFITDNGQWQSIWIKSKESSVLLYRSPLKELRISVFEEPYEFNSHMMDYTMSVKGKFSISIGDEELVQLDGSYRIYEFDGMFAVVQAWCK